MHPLELLLRATGVALLATLTIILLRLPRRDLKSRVGSMVGRERRCLPDYVDAQR